MFFCEALGNFGKLEKIQTYCKETKNGFFSNELFCLKVLQNKELLYSPTDPECTTNFEFTILYM